MIASEKPEIAAPKNPPVPEPKVSTTDTTPPSTPVAKIPGTKASPKSSTPLPPPRQKKCEARVAKRNEEKELDPEEVKRYDLWWSKYKVKKITEFPVQTVVSNRFCVALYTVGWPLHAANLCSSVRLHPLQPPQWRKPRSRIRSRRTGFVA